MYYWHCLLLLLLGFYSTTSSWAQTLPSVDVLYIEPAQPTPSDSISIIYSMTYSSTMGFVRIYDYQQVGDTLNLTICHEAGLGGAITYFRDTIVVPPLGLGGYQLNFELQRGWPDTATGACLASSSFRKGYDTLNFNVGRRNYNTNTTVGDHTVFPNPLGNGQQLNVQLSTPMTYVACYNSTGVLVTEHYLPQEYKTTLPLEDQPAGLYYVVIQSTKGTRTRTVIKR
ncbi:MAG: T9SS type A sorting domain-containing protein [Aureispira sp.]